MSIIIFPRLGKPLIVSTAGGRGKEVVVNHIFPPSSSYYYCMLAGRKQEAAATWVSSCHDEGGTRVEKRRVIDSADSPSVRLYR